MSAAPITFYNARNVSRDDLFSEELHAVNNAGERFRSADKFRRIPVMAGRHEIGALIEVRECGYRFYIAVAADMTGFEFALQFAAPCDETKALAGHLHGFKHACFGGGALRSVKSAVVAHCAQAETVEAQVEEPARAFAPGDAVIATYKGAQARGVVVREYVCPDHRKGYPDERFYSSTEHPVYVVKRRGEEREIAYGASHLELVQAAKVNAVEVGPFEYEGNGAHCSGLTRAGECVGQLVKECDTDDRRVVCYRVRSWLGEIDRYFNVSVHGTARAALKAARQFAQTL
jgi:hypothetical protein